MNRFQRNFAYIRGRYRGHNHFGVDKLRGLGIRGNAGYEIWHLPLKWLVTLFTAVLQRSIEIKRTAFVGLDTVFLPRRSLYHYIDCITSDGSSSGANTE